MSTHQFPFYPGSGAVNEVGAGAGEGYTINVPLPAGCSDVEYRQVFQDVIVPAAEKFEPEWILVSAGFDPHRRDPLAGMNVTEQGFGAMAEWLLELADRFSGSRIAFLLEGGYDLAALKNSVAAVLTSFQERPRLNVEVLKLTESRIEPLLRRIRQIHDKYQ
jgi:acetoin utilization deacetylase AcuC-like enzyme